jgi:hypothetical protein
MFVLTFFSHSVMISILRSLRFLIVSHVVFSSVGAEMSAGGSVVVINLSGLVTGLVPVFYYEQQIK